jgi:hypothetical protein
VRKASTGGPFGAPTGDPRAYRLAGGGGRAGEEPGR